MDAIVSALKDITGKLPSLECRYREPMRNHTSFKIGGELTAMLIPSCEAEMTALSEILCGHGVTPLVIGNGTNLLASDGELKLIAVKTTGLCSIGLIGDTEIKAGCGAALSRIAVHAQKNSLTGLEFAHGIPGTLGGAISMNAGAYGGEMKDVVCASEVCCETRGVFTVTGEEHNFSYRHSRFSDSEELVLSSRIKLKIGDMAEIEAKMEELISRRRESQPLNLPSAGSTFKRPANGYAAALIEQAGLKGYSVGGAQVSEKHAGFVVNRGGASFDDVMAVMDHIRETVFKRCGVELEPEVKIIR